MFVEVRGELSGVGSLPPLWLRRMELGLLVLLVKCFYSPELSCQRLHQSHIIRECMISIQIQRRSGANLTRNIPVSLVCCPDYVAQT